MYYTPISIGHHLMVIITSTSADYKKCLQLFFLRCMFFLFAFFMTGQCRADRKQSGRNRGAGSGKVHDLGFELGTPIAQGFRHRIYACAKYCNTMQCLVPLPREYFRKWNLHCVMIIYVYAESNTEVESSSDAPPLGSEAKG